MDFFQVGFIFKNDCLLVICRRRLVVRTGRCGRPDEGSILSGDILFAFDFGISWEFQNFDNLNLIVL